MLERATACLDTGARLSIRCARRASKRNSSLGPNFWSHAASDLELSPWAATSSAHQQSPPLDVHGSKQRHQHAPKPTRDETIANEDPSDGPFLDFLYPPQALALLRQNGNHRVERWETRNERRLPKGFVHANRRYSSKARSEKDVQRGTMDPDGGDTRGISRNTKRIESDPDSDRSVADTVAKELGGQDHSTNEASGSDEWHEDDYSFDEPLTLHTSTPTLSPELKELRSLMNSSANDAAFGRPDTSLVYTEKAWALFEELGNKDRQDIGLKTRLLEWLSKHRNETAETYCLELYHSIPAAHRTLSVYKSALPAFIRSNLYGLAEQGHAEALDRLPNGHEVSVWLCRIAIEKKMWDLASRVKHQLDAKYDGQATAWTDNMFWRQISETPSLLAKAINLSKHYRMLNQADALTPEFQRFSISMFKVAIIHQFTASPNKKGRNPSDARKSLDDSRIRYLIGRIQLTNPDSPRFFRDVIEALIFPNSGVRHHDACKTVSYMYRQYRTMSHVFLGQKLLSFLTMRIAEHTETRAGKRKGSSLIAPSVLDEDWVKYHGRMNLRTYRSVMLHYAKSGNIERVKSYCERLREQYSSYADLKEVLWILIYAYARRGEVKAATSAFEEVQSIAEASGEPLDLRNWNVLLHAHSRADDLDGALEVMDKLADAGIKPDVYSIHPVLEMYAARGDVSSVENLLGQCDELIGPTRRTELYGSLMTAHINANDVDSAQKVLGELVPKVWAGEVEGTLTKCFNILLTALSLQREVESTMEVYRWMKAENVGVNSLTYAAIMQGLATYRQADAAWKILNSTMPEEGHKPQAFHYAIVMTGFVRQHAYKTAMDIYATMIRRNIKSTLNTDAIYAKARALYQVRHNPEGRQVNPASASRIVEELDELLRDPNAGLAPHQPQFYSPMEDHSPRALMFSHLIYSYGSRKSISAVKLLVKKYTQSTENGGKGVFEPLPLRVLTAVMPAYINAKSWEEVEECWRLAKEQADTMTIGSRPHLDPAPSPKTPPNILKLSVAKTTDESQMPKRKSKRAATIKKPDPTRPVPSLRHVLSQPLRHHITSLALQRRFGEMITTVASVLNEGYILDNSTWNIFIEHLLRSTPPLALLAFRLTEKYLTPSFPGWIHYKHHANRSSHVQRLPHIRASYLTSTQLMPRYRTLVKLGAAYLAVRRRDALGDERSDLTSNGNEGLDKYVGSTRQIRKDAPETLYAVQTMPAIDDTLQTTLLRRKTVNY
jgi:pentatricopeptide repeat-containing protein PET309